MSAIQLLEKIGASAALTDQDLTDTEKQTIQNLIDVCPDIVCVIAPAEDDDDDGGEKEDDKEEISMEQKFSIAS